METIPWGYVVIGLFILACIYLAGPTIKNALGTKKVAQFGRIISCLEYLEHVEKGVIPVSSATSVTDVLDFVLEHLPEHVKSFTVTAEGGDVYTTSRTAGSTEWTLQDVLAHFNS